MDTNPGTTTTDPLRTTLHGMWAGVAPAWREHAAYIDDRGAPVSDAMLAAAALAGGERVLELGCGPGGLGLAAAATLGSTGSVVLSDVAPDMVAIAADRASASGLANVTTAVLDLEAVEAGDGSFDVVLCREALMLVPDPARAVAEAHRVLRVGGRAVFAVWGPRADNPWLGALFDGVTAATGMPVPPPGLPGPFSLDDAETVRSLFAATFSEVTVTSVSTPTEVRSFDEWWSRIPALAGPLAAVIASLPDDVVGRIQAEARSRLAEYAVGDGYAIPGLATVVAARRRPI